jgi:hypothetical protein
MARAWRIECEGALYHVLSRGNQRQAIFIADEVRLLLDNLAEIFFSSSDKIDADILEC